MSGTTAVKDDLWFRLRGARATMIDKVDGLSEYDLRRPMTPTGTNLLGLIKHLAGEEYGYLGEVFGRPASVRPSWFRDDPATEIDMWATPGEASSYIVEVYRQATAHADETIRVLDLDSPGTVPHWGENGQTTLGSMLVLMVGETAQHAGQADIVRELLDGVVGAPNLDRGSGRLAEVQAAADLFR
ncbi:MAG TPA: DinB family protein [Microlunatus sp.]